MQRLRAIDESLYLSFREHLQDREGGDYEAAEILLVTDGLQRDDLVDVVADLVAECWRMHRDTLRGREEGRAQQVLSQ